MHEAQPVFGVCGYSGSGKTTLLESVVPRFVRRGVKVAVLKHDAHGLDRDQPGKDSDRLFRVGADVVVCGPSEMLARVSSTAQTPLEAVIDRLVPRYDLILLEGFKHWSGRKAWLLQSDEATPPADIGPCDPILDWTADRPDQLESALTRFLADQVEHAPLLGCVLIGGASRRMECAKHLLTSGSETGETWLHRTVRVLQAHCQQVVLAGRAQVPEYLRHLPHLPDSPGVNGPMAGLLSAMRWAPRAAWLVTACDLSLLSPEALSWVLSQRNPGVWAVLGRVSERAPVEPLLAWYDFRCREFFESLATGGHSAMRCAAEHPKSRVTVVPAGLAEAWNDADTPEQASGLLSRVTRPIG